MSDRRAEIEARLRMASRTVYVYQTVRTETGNSVSSHPATHDVLCIQNVDAHSDLRWLLDALASAEERIRLCDKLHIALAAVEKGNAG